MKELKSKKRDYTVKELKNITDIYCQEPAEWRRTGLLEVLDERKWNIKLDNGQFIDIGALTLDEGFKMMAGILGGMPKLLGKIMEERVERLGYWAYWSGYILQCQKPCSLITICERVQRTFHFPKNMGCAGEASIVKSIGGGWPL